MFVSAESPLLASFSGYREGFSPIPRPMRFAASCLPSFHGKVFFLVREVQILARAIEVKGDGRTLSLRHYPISKVGKCSRAFILPTETEKNSLTHSLTYALVQ